LAIFLQVSGIVEVVDDAAVRAVDDPVGPDLRAALAAEAADADPWTTSYVRHQQPPDV
jgi:hypothetical protein